jgi:hypothetical protein
MQRGQPLTPEKERQKRRELEKRAARKFRHRPLRRRVEDANLCR